MDRERLSAPVGRAPGIEFADRPAIAAIQAIAAVLAEVLGPMCWAALILLFLYAELFTR